ncbi:MAG TPA: hypothetical protein VHZ76_03325 [Gammaproteobacteria bacterium]|jgi:hypothetical protein|nr:hypothetical protein [Gammaproteobacteria bacterium]
MSTLTKEQEQYIEHEVQLRLHDQKFNSLERAIERLENRLETSFTYLDNKIDSSIKHLDNKLSWAIGIFIGISLIGWMLPIALQFIKINH